MHRTPVIVPGLVILLIAGLLMAGCSAPETPGQTAQPATTAGPGPRYIDGDVVRNPASGSSAAWLVLGYDAASDKYERALIYPNDDGSWGYRKDSRTEKADRSVMEKVYSEIVTNTPPSSVPVVTPTIVTPEATEVTTTSPAAATATAAAPKTPVFTSIIPDEGYAGTSVSVKNLAGDNFVTGATVTLSRNGSAAITATDVRVVTNKSIICTFVIPSNAAVGAWDVSVRNPDGRSTTFSNIFTVHRDLSVVATTSAVYAGTLNITYVDPPFAYSTSYKEYVITGSKFQNGAGVKLLKEGKTDIEGTTVRVTSDTEIRCFFRIPSGSMGNWDILVTNPDQTFGRWFGGFEVRG